MEDTIVTRSRSGSFRRDITESPTLSSPKHSINKPPVHQDAKPSIRIRIKVLTDDGRIVCGTPITDASDTETRSSTPPNTFADAIDTKPTINRGSKYCNYPGGCNKFAQGNTRHCITHGGGRICDFQNCSRSAQGANSTRCIRHGGGKRCEAPGCKTSARGKTRFCVIHGGGYKCKHEGGCTKSAQRPSDYCIAHGGGRRCEYPGCTITVRAKTLLCRKHDPFDH